MTLIKSISGIRGTIGGFSNQNLTPPDILKFTQGYAIWLKERNKDVKLKVIVGRDARISGEMVNNLVTGTLMGMGIDVIDLGLSTTPTVEMAVPMENAHGGIILTASHNPIQWNALKLLNEKGEFVSGAEGEKLLEYAEKKDITYPEVLDLGSYKKDDTYIDKHIDEIIKLGYVDKEKIASRNFKIVVDAVNSTGGIAIPRLLKKLGVSEIIELYCEPNGHFPHNPEPLAENLSDISNAVVKLKADLGIVVDPDVDRLAFVCEDGRLFGEEYTLVSIADYIMQTNPGPAVSNLSSTRALRDVAQSHNQNYFASAVGEVNVVEMMKKQNAVIGGEGNGGVILPDLHYGRDALAGIALFLSQLATNDESELKVSSLRANYNTYYMSKNKMELTPDINVDDVLLQMRDKYINEEHSTIDGLKIEFESEWVHLRKSNTEPIIRIYAESSSEESANELTSKIMSEITSIINN